MKIAVINGPNMNLLGIREPEHYGRVKLSDINEKIGELAKTLECEVIAYQSNYEGDIVDFIQKNMNELDGIVINPAALSSIGYSVIDAIEAKHIPFMEVHMSNIYARGADHEKSIFSKYARGVIIGLREDSYILAFRGMVDYLKNRI